MNDELKCKGEVVCCGPGPWFVPMLLNQCNSCGRLDRAKGVPMVKMEPDKGCVNFEQKEGSEAKVAG